MWIVGLFFVAMGVCGLLSGLTVSSDPECRKVLEQAGINPERMYKQHWPLAGIGALILILGIVMITGSLINEIRLIR